MVLLNQPHKPRSTKELAFTVRGLCDSVRMKYKNISGLQRHSPFFIGHFFENAERKTRRHESPFNAPLAHQLVHLFEHFRGLQLLRSKTAHDSDSHRSIEGGGRALAAHVPQRNS